MPKLLFHPDVYLETKVSYDWYQKQADGLGNNFINELETAYQGILDFPLSWSIFQDGFRRYLLPKFPFSVIYKENKNLIYIVAVMHNSRKPGYWIERS